MNGRLTGWDRAAWCLIATHVVLLLSHWPALPFFVDIYYHLNVLSGFREAGGIVLHDVWEFAPAGRPHLYPPALHVALLGLDWLHLAPITLARLATVLPYPALLLCGWWFAREWLGSSAAYWTTVCALTPFSYLLVACNTVAASWALVLWLLGLIAVRRQALTAFILSSALVFYTHLGTPWLMVCSWLLLARCHRPSRKVLGVGSAVTSVLALPWLLHLAVHHRAFGPMSTMENAYPELPLLLYGLAAWGAMRGWRTLRPEARCASFSLMLSLAPLLLHYRFRFWSGQGLLGITLFAGVGLAAAAAWVERVCRERWKIAPTLIPLLMTAVLFMGNPTAFIQAGGTFLALGDSSLTNLALGRERVTRSNAQPFYYPQLIDPLVQFIDEQTQADEIIGCNLPYTCGLVAALSGRAMATGMLSEVRDTAGSVQQALGHAQLIVWFKVPPTPGLAPLQTLRQEWHLALVRETEMAYLFRNPTAGERRRFSRPVVPLWLAWTLLGASVAGIAWDLSRHSAPLPV